MPIGVQPANSHSDYYHRVIKQVHTQYFMQSWLDEENPATEYSINCINFTEQYGG